MGTSPRIRLSFRDLRRRFILSDGSRLSARGIARRGCSGLGSGEAGSCGLHGEANVSRIGDGSEGRGLETGSGDGGGSRIDVRVYAQKQKEKRKAYLRSVCEAFKERRELVDIRIRDVSEARIHGQVSEEKYKFVNVVVVGNSVTVPVNLFVPIRKGWVAENQGVDVLVRHI